MLRGEEVLVVVVAVDGEGREARAVTGLAASGFEVGQRGVQGGMVVEQVAELGDGGHCRDRRGGG